MAEYIEREAAIKLFNFAVLDCLGMEPTIRAGDIIKALESIPAADAIEELTGFVQEAERDRDEYRERLDKAADAIEFLQTYKVAFENIISMGGWWLVGQDKNLYRMSVPMNWPPTGTKTVELFPLPQPPNEEKIS